MLRLPRTGKSPAARLTCESVAAAAQHCQVALFRHALQDMADCRNQSTPASSVVCPREAVHLLFALLLT